MARYDFHLDKDQWCSNCRCGGHYKCKKKTILKRTGKVCTCDHIIIKEDTK